MTSAILAAMKAAVEGHAWLGTAPASIVQGPIPFGLLAYPVLGIDASRDDEADSRLAYFDSVEQFTWTLALDVDLDGYQTAFLAMMIWRDEARALARAAGIDGKWGLPCVMQSDLVGWSLPKVEPGSTVMTVELRLVVRYIYALAAPVVSDISYTAAYGATVLTCTTNRAARVRFKMTTTGLVDELSAWSNVGTTHAGLICRTAGGRTWTLYVCADAVIDPDLDWYELGEIVVPPRGAPPVDGGFPNTE